MVRRFQREKKQQSNENVFAAFLLAANPMIKMLLMKDILTSDSHFPL